MGHHAFFVELFDGGVNGAVQASYGNWGKSPGKDEPPSNLYH